MFNILTVVAVIAIIGMINYTINCAKIVIENTGKIVDCTNM